MTPPIAASELLVATVLADIALVLLVGAVLGRAVRRLRQPAVLGEILAGIALGPTLLGLLPGDLPAARFPAQVRGYLSAIAQVGLLLFMFVMGWEFDRRLLGNRRSLAATVSLSSIAVSFAFGVALATVLYGNHWQVAGHRVAFVPFALFMGAAMAITAFPVLARILAERRLAGTPVGALALASAAIDDVLAWCVLALVAALATAHSGLDLVRTAVLSLAYVALLATVVRPLLAALVRRLVNSPSLLVVVAAGVFLSAGATTWIGIHAIFGAFAFGFVMPREPAEALRQGLGRPLNQVTTILLPVFFVVTGLGVDLGALSTRDYVELVAIVVVACAGKLIGATVPARAFGLPWSDVRTLGLLMNTRGLTELIILNAGVALGILDGRLFTMMVLMALVTTAMAGPLLGPPAIGAAVPGTVADPPVHVRTRR
jgi:Kef-type K+ transport system membrane component KefB